MKKEEYNAARKVMLDQAQALLDESKIEEFEAKCKEIEALDAQYDAQATAAANLRAVSDDPWSHGSMYDVLNAHSADIRDGTVIARADFTGKDIGKGENNMKNALEVQAFQKFVASGGDIRTMTDDLRNAITTTGSGAVLPVDIFHRMLTDEKYSDLLHRATLINQGGAGTIKIPVASSSSAVWKTEGEAVTPENPKLTSIDLGGVELMRLIQYSAAVDALSIENFAGLMASLVSSELVETLERAFIGGSTKTGQPHDGLDNLTWTAGTNLVETAGTTTAISAADVAKGISLLPQKYARNAVLLMSADTAYNTVGLFKGTSEYAYNIADGAGRFMGREIIINEHCSDGAIDIVDPKELYVRFAMPPLLEVDRSSGFTSATTSMRCLAVVDYAWNPAACVRVRKKAA